MHAKKLLAYLLIILTVFLTACGGPATDSWPETGSGEHAIESGSSAEQSSQMPSDVQKSGGTLKVHFIDVGQADCILIQAPTGENMLIDAGNNDDKDTIVSYLNAQGVKKIDVLVGTHPHEDHIGSLDTVIDTFDIGKIYMPKATTTTKTFEDVLTAVRNKGLKITAAVGGTSINFSPDTKVEVLAPNSNEYKDLNNYSAVIKLIYGNVAFLFTGDAEHISENEMLAGNYDLRADILKVGHHGSNSSTTDAFLAAVNPSYAVICVGKGNDYGHPHKEVLDRLSKAGIKVYRTDESGTVTITTDGEKIEIGTAKTSDETSKKSQPAKKDITVYITKTGKKYHLEECNLIRDNKIPIKLSEAKEKGYEPCKTCKPPQ
ncbi:MAG TPA: MBL fold metallo-hydrolase [Thermoanaerobacterales bacterium]|nr:MBL fold metallo-hydrolase [Thermoanaerobacterales bacterium]